MPKKILRKINSKVNNAKAVKRFWIIFFAPFALLLFLLLLTATGLFGPLPSFDDLENPKSNLATEIYTEDGQMLGGFFLQNRSYTSYEELSPNVWAALVSTEDERFYSHSGIDFLGLMRVGVKTVALGQNQGGGSTITQQLAKNLYKTRDTVAFNNPVVRYSRLMVSKLKEWITAVMLEYNYTKEEIIAMYLNTVEYGSNAYGIKSAARTFFNKTPDELTIEEAAMLVGLVNKPTRYSPVRNPENAIKRRNLVLSRMRVHNFITSDAQLDSLEKVPIKLDYKPIAHDEGSGTYFREMLRLLMNAEEPKRKNYDDDWKYNRAVKMWEEDPLYGWCNKNLKSDGTKYNLYKDGLKIYTTINSVMQRYAEESLTEQMATVLQPKMDAQVKATKTLFNNVNKGEIETMMLRAMKQTDRYRALVQAGASEAEINKSFDTPTEMRIFTYKGDVDTLMTPRDSILHHKRYLRASFMAMDPSTGFIKAYVGGQDFKYFKYDMVRQGSRQVGSTIKPFVYTFAIDHLGLTPCTMVPNLPVNIETFNADAWSPREAGKVVYDGVEKPLYWGLANSRNNYSAWIMKQAKQPEAVADFIYKMGIKSYIDPVVALCLGVADVTLYEMVSAYATYANRGVFTEPVFVTRIEDRQGNVLATFTAQTSDAISEQTAYTMLGMLKRVVSAGTAGRLRSFGVSGEAGGKTGTSQNNADAWFIGVTPKLVGGAWVGGEDRSVHLRNNGEGSASALPIFGGFLKRIYADKSLGVTTQDQFPIPVGGVVYDCKDEGSSAVVKPNEADDDEFFK